MVTLLYGPVEKSLLPTGGGGLKPPKGLDSVKGFEVQKPLPAFSTNEGFQFKINNLDVDTPALPKTPMQINFKNEMDRILREKMEGKSESNHSIKDIEVKAVEGTGKDAKIPRTGAEWDEYFRSKYRDDNVTWVTKNNFEYVDGFDDHLINAQSIVRKGNKGVVGGHNLASFEKILTDQGWNVDDLIVSKTPHPTIPEVYQIQYRLPALDRELKVIPDQYKNISHPKTVYDPSVISNDQIIQWGKEAMANGEIVGREIRGTASNGLKFTGYLDENGKVTNFFPTISE
jgi:hypothetical protein